MPSLYVLTGDRLALQNKLELLDIDSQTIEDTLEANSAELEAKISDYGYVIRNLESFTDTIKAEETRLAERRKAHEKRVEHIKSWLLTNMQACGITKIECPAFAITVKTNPPKVVVEDSNLVPAIFMTVPEPPAPYPDKKLIAAKLKSGEVVPGCRLEQAQRVEIK